MIGVDLHGNPIPLPQAGNSIVPTIAAMSAIYDAAHIMKGAYDYYKGWGQKHGPLHPRYTRTRRRRGAKGGFTAKVKRIISQVSETKFIEVGISTSAPVAGTSVLQLLSGVAQGDTNLLRDGEIIEMQSVQVRGKVRLNAAAAASLLPRVFRIILFQARHNIEGVIPTVAEVLSADSAIALKQIDNRGEFKVLWSILASHPTPAISTQATDFVVDKYYKFKKPIRATYDGTDALIASMEKNHLFLIMMTESATNLPLFNFNVRIVFKDV